MMIEKEAGLILSRNRKKRFNRLNRQGVPQPALTAYV